MRTCVVNVAVQNHSPDACDVLEHQTSRVILLFLKHVAVWEELLASHPDRTFVSNLIHGIKHGVNIGYKGDRQYSL